MSELSEETVLPVTATTTETPADPPAEGSAPAADPTERMTVGDQARQAIFARVTEQRAADANDESLSAQGDEIARIANRGEEAAAGDESAADPAAVATGEETRTIRVDGQDKTVPLSEIEKAGIAALQKDTASELRLERAARAEREAVALRDQLQARLDQAGKVLSAAPPDQGALPGSGRAAPSTDAPANPEAVEALRQAQEALLDGDLGRGSELLNTVIAASVAKAMLAAGKTPEPPAGANANAGATAAAPWVKEEVEKANQYFADAFFDVAGNPQRMAYAVERIKAEMADPANRGLDLSKITRLVGLEARRLPDADLPRSPPPAATGASVPGSTPIGRGRVLKARIPAIPTGGNLRGSGAPASGTDRPQSGSEYVQQLRKSRGLPT
jgi:hypothetical protein